AGIRVIKAFVREPDESRRFEARVDGHLRQNLRISTLFSFTFPPVFLIANRGREVLRYAASRLTGDGNLTLGEWQQFSLYLVYVFFPLGNLGFIISLMSQAAASAERIFEILGAENEVETRPGAVEMGQVQGHVVFENVSFRYFKH